MEFRFSGMCRWKGTWIDGLVGEMGKNHLGRQVSSFRHECPRDWHSHTEASSINIPSSNPMRRSSYRFTVTRNEIDVATFLAKPAFDFPEICRYRSQLGGIKQLVGGRTSHNIHNPRLLFSRSENDYFSSSIFSWLFSASFQSLSLSVKTQDQEQRGNWRWKGHRTYPHTGCLLQLYKTIPRLSIIGSVIDDWPTFEGCQLLMMEDSQYSFTIKPPKLWRY